MQRILATLVMLLIPLAAARADTVILLDGSSIEGEIIKEDDNEITVKGRFGKTVIARKDIREIQKKDSARGDFLKKQDELKKGESANDAQSWMTLGYWAKKEGLREEADKAFGEALKLEPNNDKAHEAMGHIRYLGQWVTPEEKRRREAKDGGNAGINVAPAVQPKPENNAAAGGGSATAGTGMVGGSSGSSKRVKCSSCSGTG